MLDFVIFAFTFLIALIIASIWLYPSSKRITTVPGLDPSSKEGGNLEDVGRAGSLHEFLLDLHGKFGPIAGFWWGKTYVVSIASPQLFKEHQHAFDRPPLFYSMFEPLIGQRSIQYANGSDGRTRRNHYDRAFSHQHLPRYCSYFQKVADTVLEAWLEVGIEDHLPLTVHTFNYAIRCALGALLGKKVKDEETVSKIRHGYQTAWDEMEDRLVDPTIPDESSLRAKQFKEALESMCSVIQDAVALRKERSLKKQGNKLIDILMEVCPDEQTLLDDTITFLTGGFHTTYNASPSLGDLDFADDLVLISSNYEDQQVETTFLSKTASQVQDKLYNEIMEVLGCDGNMNGSNFSQLKYVMQVIDETLRCAVIAPHAARFHDFDTELGGHKIPKNTPVIHALGTVLLDEKIWPSPEKFDPERFNEENTKSRTSFAFLPFGFAGKRKCPAYKFAYWEAAVFLVTLIRRFEISVWNDQVVKPVHGLVTHPEEEIWLKVVKRK